MTRVLPSTHRERAISYPFIASDPGNGLGALGQLLPLARARSTDLRRSKVGKEPTC